MENVKKHDFMANISKNHFLSHLKEGIRNIFVKKYMGFKHQLTLPWTLKKLKFQYDSSPN